MAEPTGPAYGDDLTSKPTQVDHLVRHLPPWRAPEDAMTECGRPVTEVQSTATSDEIRARIKRVGKARAAFTVCMTCVDRERWATSWERDPISVLARDTKRVGEYYTNRVPDSSSKPSEHRRYAERAALTAELRALAALAEAHPDEFRGYITGLASTTDLTARRQQRRATNR
jgi:hypothetical protein